MPDAVTQVTAVWCCTVLYDPCKCVKIIHHKTWSISLTYQSNQNDNVILPQTLADMAVQWHTAVSELLQSGMVGQTWSLLSI